MINDPKLTALAEAMTSHLSERYHSGDHTEVAFIDDDGGPAFVTVDGKVDFETLAAVAMAKLGIEFDWAEHDRSAEIPVDAKGLSVDVLDTTPGEVMVCVWRAENLDWKHVRKWRPSLENWR